MPFGQFSPFMQKSIAMFFLFNSLFLASFANLHLKTNICCGYSFLCTSICILQNMHMPHFQNENGRCFDIFTAKEQKILMKYRKENFADKKLIPRERRLMGKCPLTPEEVLKA